MNERLTSWLIIVVSILVVIMSILLVLAIGTRLLQDWGIL